MAANLQVRVFTPRMPEIRLQAICSGAVIMPILRSASLSTIFQGPSDDDIQKLRAAPYDISLPGVTDITRM